MTRKAWLLDTSVALDDKLSVDVGVLREWKHKSFLPNSNPSTVEGGADDATSLTKHLTPNRLGGLCRGNDM